ncbi:MAG: DUF3343 domain-containing protein [Oscillospiraceae bacterium]|nr:DUF3343 domain-containing protein [Oscillospiraceae bacterium]
MVLTFQTTTAALAMEALCARQGLSGRLIPVPVAVTAGCGMAWCAPVSCRTDLERAAAAARVSVAGVYELLL